MIVTRHQVSVFDIALVEHVSSSFGSYHFCSYSHHSREQGKKWRATHLSKHQLSKALASCTTPRHTHTHTHTLVRAERDHVTSSSISVFFCFFATVEDNTKSSQESWRGQRLDIYSPAPLCGGQQPLLFRGTIRALRMPCWTPACLWPHQPDHQVEDDGAERDHGQSPPEPTHEQIAKVAEGRHRRRSQAQAPTQSLRLLNGQPSEEESTVSPRAAARLKATCCR